MGFPEPLKTRPNISSDTGVLRMSPVNSQSVFLASIPDVPSKTCTTAFEPLTSKTCPERKDPSDNLSDTISANFGNLTSSKMTSGPFTPDTVLYAEIEGALVSDIQKEWQSHDPRTHDRVTHGTNASRENVGNAARGANSSPDSFAVSARSNKPRRSYDHLAATIDQAHGEFGLNNSKT